MSQYLDEYRAAYDALEEAGAFDPRDAILCDVEVEMARQDEKWGEQNHPDFGYQPDQFHFIAQADHWKATNDRRVGLGALGWDGVLLEEVYEALAESDPAKLRAELIQVAAVATQWIAAIDRRPLQ